MYFDPGNVKIPKKTKSRSINVKLYFYRENQNHLEKYLDRKCWKRAQIGATDAYCSNIMGGASEYNI
jgi:hypothetical protein